MTTLAVALVAIFALGCMESAEEKKTVLRVGYQPSTHQVAEIDGISTELTAMGLSLSDLETDGILSCRIWREYGAGSDTYNDSLWVKKVDLHYQSDHFSTPSKASDFFDPFDGS